MACCSRSRFSTSRIRSTVRSSKKPSMSRPSTLDADTQRAVVRSGRSARLMRSVSPAGQSMRNVASGPEGDLHSRDRRAADRRPVLEGAAIHDCRRIATSASRRCCCGTRSGEDVFRFVREPRAAGVMMIPIPQKGHAQASARNRGGRRRGRRRGGAESPQSPISCWRRYRKREAIWDSSSRAETRRARWSAA